MKKLLLTGAALMALTFTAKAQETTSFETSEGYTTGNINGQKGWASTTYTTEEGGDETFYIENQVVSTEFHSVGANSLKIATEDAFGSQQNPVIGAFRGYENAETEWTVSYDIYIVPEGDVADGNDYTFNLYSSSEENAGFAARVDFSFESLVKIVDFNEDGDLDYVTTEFAWEPETWYHVEIENTGDEVIYTINDEVVLTGSVLNSDFVTLAATIDNWGGTAYFDGITVTGATAGVKPALANKFSVSPNPANNVVTIANADNMLVNAVSVTDMNGRTVKTLAFDGVAQAQVNVSDLANGVYMMTISSDKGSVTKKIVKN